MSDARFGSWSAAESTVTIEYSLVVIEEIRHEVSEGFQKLSRGGVEVGGLLYGTREGRTVRLLAMRPIACEHARGPAFQLSDADRELLEEQIEHGAEDPQLADLICLGWFVSHTRSEILLGEADLEFYQTYFSAPWQVTLVIRPGRGGSMRAGFFVREADGTVRSESSYLEFNFPDRLAGVLDRPARADRPAGTRGHTVYFRESGAGAAPAAARRELPQTLPAGPQLMPAQPPRAKWPWLAGWGVAAAAAVVLAVRYFAMPAPQLLDLAVAERNGQLQIQWSRDAKPVAAAARGTLLVTDGQTPSRTIALTKQDLERGNFSYKRNSDDVEVQLSVESAGGDKTQSKTTTFLAAAPSKSEDEEKIKAVESERDALQAQVDQLKSENAQQADRILQLERDLKVLQTRLGIQ